MPLTDNEYGRTGHHYRGLSGRCLEMDIVDSLSLLNRAIEDIADGGKDIGHFLKIVCEEQ